MGIEEQFGEIVIAPRVLEKIIAIATAKVEGVHSFSNKSVSDTLSKLSLGRGVYTSMPTLVAAKLPKRSNKPATRGVST